MDLNDNSYKLRQKKLIYRSCYTGMKETDLILGNFAKQYVFDMAQEELEQFSDIVELGDTLLYDWLVIGKPEEAMSIKRNQVTEKLSNFAKNFFDSHKHEA